MSGAVTVYKLDERGVEVWQYPARVLLREPRSVKLEATFDRERVDLGFVAFCRGDRFVETFYDDRWFNVFAVYDGASSSLKGWYCNICRPAELTKTAVRCEDLALDVWADAAGDFRLLDQDEFAALELAADERRACLTAVTQLQIMAAEGALPR